MSNEIRLTGFKEFEAKLKALPQKLQVTADSYVKDAALEWVQLAKTTAPRDQNGIAGRISSYRSGDLSYDVVSPANYSRFVEWGTKKYKNVPSDLANYEAGLGYQKSGDYYDFLSAILDWVKRKGIGVTYKVATRRKNRQSKDEYLAIAQAIANSISRHGIKPQPFFFIHKDGIEKTLFARLQKLLNTPQ